MRRAWAYHRRGRIAGDGERAIQNFVACWAAGPAFIVRHFWLMRLKTWARAPISELLEPWTLGLANWFRDQEAREPGMLARAVAFFDSLAPQVDAFSRGMMCTLRRCCAASRQDRRICANHRVQELLDGCIDYITYTPLHNAIGAPAMSVPLGMSPEGLPIGAHFAARVGDERTLLELAYELEQARPWANRWPPVSAAA